MNKEAQKFTWNSEAEFYFQLGSVFTRSTKLRVELKFGRTQHSSLMGEGFMGGLYTPFTNFFDF